MFDDVGEVAEAWGTEEVNKMLADGWKLLAVVQGTVPNAQSHIKYVLGKPKAKTGTGLYGQPV